MSVRAWFYFQVATPVLTVFGCVSGVKEPRFPKEVTEGPPGKARGDALERRSCRAHAHPPELLLCSGRVVTSAHLCSTSGGKSRSESFYRPSCSSCKNKVGLEVCQEVRTARVAKPCGLVWCAGVPGASHSVRFSTGS